MKYDEVAVVGFTFKCGKVDGRQDNEYNAENYYYAGAYQQGYDFGKLEVKLIQDAIDTINVEWNNAHQHESWMLANEIEGLRAQYIMKLEKLQKGE